MSYFIKTFFILRLFLFFPVLIGLSAYFFHLDTTSTEKQDLVKNLRTRLLEDGFSIELTWTPPDDEGEIIIARSKERMDTPEKLYYADSLGRYPNKKGEALRSFKDINLKPGTYYYAIAMVSRIKKRDVELVGGENYTLNPVDIGVTVQIPKNVPKENLPYAHDNAHSISEIDIKHYKDYNQIRWVAPMNADNSKPIYHLYRSPEPLSSVPLLQKAEKIIELNHPDTFYVDKKIVPGQIYYYGVSVSIKGEEYIPLVENKSFARSHKVATSTVPSTKNVVSESRAEEAKKEEFSAPTKKEASPTEKTELPPSKKETTLANLENPPSKKEVTPQAETISPKKEEKGSIQVSDLNYEYKGEGIFLTWSGPEEAISNTTVYTVYFSPSNPKNLEQALEKGKARKLGEVTHPDMSFSIPKMDRKKIAFLAVSTRQGSGKEYMQFVEDESFIRIEPEKETLAKKEENTTPKEKEKPQEEEPKPQAKTEKKEEPESKTENIVPSKKETGSMGFDQIMTDYYRKRRFEEARKLLEEFAKREQDPEEKAKAVFYSALCYYNMGKYDAALKILLKKELKRNFNRERVEFYINRCIEKQGKNE